VAAKHRLLDRDGIANVGEYILPGDVYINLQVRQYKYTWHGQQLVVLVDLLA
jgi:hypothetical protein